jgi:hypothetical protein
MFQRLFPSAIGVTNTVATPQIMLLVDPVYTTKGTVGQSQATTDTTNHVACHWSFIGIYFDWRPSLKPVCGWVP